MRFSGPPSDESRLVKCLSGRNAFRNLLFFFTGAGLQRSRHFGDYRVGRPLLSAAVHVAEEIGRLAHRR